MHRRFAGVGGILGRGDLCVNEWDRARVIQMDVVNTKSGQDTFTAHPLKYVS